MPGYPARRGANAPLPPRQSHQPQRGARTSKPGTVSRSICTKPGPASAANLGTRVGAAFTSHVIDPTARVAEAERHDSQRDAWPAAGHGERGSRHTGVGAAGRDADRDVHDRPGLFHRERGDPVDAAATARQRGRGRMGGDRVRADLRGGAHHRRAARGPVRAAADVHAGPGRLHAGLAGLRAGHQHRDAQRQPRDTGARCGCRGTADAGHDRPDLRGQAAGHRGHRVRREPRPGRGAGPAVRWSAHPGQRARAGLAELLPGQPAGRGGRAGRRAPAADRVARPRRGQHRPGGHGAGHGGPGRGDPAAGRRAAGALAGVGLGAAGGRGPDPGRVRRAPDLATAAREDPAGRPERTGRPDRGGGPGRDRPVLRRDGLVLRGAGPLPAGRPGPVGPRLGCGVHRGRRGLPGRLDGAPVGHGPARPPVARPRRGGDGGRLPRAGPRLRHQLRPGRSAPATGARRSAPERAAAAAPAAGHRDRHGHADRAADRDRAGPGGTGTSRHGVRPAGHHRAARQLDRGGGDRGGVLQRAARRLRSRLPGQPDPAGRAATGRDGRDPVRPPDPPGAPRPNPPAAPGQPNQVRASAQP